MRKIFYSPYQDTTEVNSAVGGYRPSQPSQKYPFRPNKPPRADNSNQPWYGSNTRWWGKGPDTVNGPDSVTSVGGKKIFYIEDIWASLNKFFGGDDSKANLKDKSQVFGSSSFGSDNERAGS